MRRRTKLARVYPILAVVLTLVACSPAASVSPSTGASGAATGTEGPSASEAAVELNVPAFVWGDPSELPFWEQVVERYQAKYTNVTIDNPEIPFEGYHDAMFADMAAGNPPDIVYPYDPQLGQWIDEGLLEPLNPWLDEIGVGVDDLIGMHELAIKDGQIYAVIVSSNPRVLLYNEALFEEAGASVPTNVDEFTAAIEAINENDVNKFGYATMSAAAAAGITYLEQMPIVAGHGGAFFTDGRPTANTDEVKAAWAFIEDLYDRKLIPVGQDQTVYREEFVQGQVASLTVGGFMMGVARDQAPENFATMSATQLPFPAGNTVAVNVFIGIPSAAKDKEAAGRFIQEVLADEMQPEIPRVMTAIPARLGLVPEDFVSENPWFQEVIDASERATSYVPEGVGALAPEIMELITMRYQEMLFTDATAAESADLLQADLEAFMAEQP